MRLTLLTVVACAAGALLGSAARADTAATTPPLPPGMTPAVYKMIMTPGQPHPPGLPADVVPQLGCIPTMGFHYAAPGELADRSDLRLVRWKADLH